MKTGRHANNRTLPPLCHVRIGWLDGAMKTATPVSTRQVLHDFGLACLLALGVGASVGLVAAAAVTLVATLNP